MHVFFCVLDFLSVMAYQIFILSTGLKSHISKNSVSTTNDITEQFVDCEINCIYKCVFSVLIEVGQY